MKNIDWTLPITTQAVLNTALFELREAAEHLRARLEEEHPQPSNGYELGSAQMEVDAWVEDLEHLVADLDTLDYQCPSDLSTLSEEAAPTGS